MEDNEKKSKELQMALDNSMKQTNMQPVFSDGVITRFRIKFKVASKQDLTVESQSEKTMLFEIIFFDSITKIVTNRIIIDKFTASDLILQIQEASSQFSKMQSQS